MPYNTAQPEDATSGSAGPSPAAAGGSGRGFAGENATSDEQKAAKRGLPDRSPKPNASEADDRLMLRYAFYVVALALVLVALIFAAAAAWHVWAIGEAPDDRVASMMAAAFAVIGTLVGTFVGHHFGASGRERAETRAEEARWKKDRVKGVLVRKVLVALPEEAEELLDEIEEIEGSAAG